MVALMLRRSLPAISGLARMHHSAKWLRSSISLMPLPTSSTAHQQGQILSLSFQNPGPAHGASGSSVSIIPVMCGQLGLMSPPTLAEFENIQAVG